MLVECVLTDKHAPNERTEVHASWSCSYLQMYSSICVQPDYLNAIEQNKVKLREQLLSHSKSTSTIPMTDSQADWNSNKQFVPQEQKKFQIWFMT